MNVTYSKDVIQAFVAGTCELKKLTELLQDRIGKVKIQVDCADDFSREFETVEDLINFENPKSKEIRCIHLSAYSDNYSERATIVLPRSFRGGISVEFAAREDVISRLREDVQDILVGMRPWYNILARVEFSNSNFLIFALLAWFVVLQVSIYENLGEEKKIAMTVPAIILSGSLWVFIMGLFFGGNKLRDFFFPSAVFTIGQGASRFKNKEWVRRGMVISFPVSLVAGLIIWLMTR